MTWSGFWHKFDQARAVPRACVAAYGVMTWNVTEWFMGIPDPTNAQGVFVSVVYGAIPFLLNFYMQNGVRWDGPMLPPPNQFVARWDAPRTRRVDIPDDR